MMRRLRAFASDRGGLAAMEFAFIAPIVAVMLVVGVDGWLRETHMSQIRTATQTGIRYYQTGGSDDTIAQTVSVAAWSGKPANGVLNVVRSCTCPGGSTVVTCTTVCPGNNPPSAFLTLTASGTYSGLMHSHALSQSDVIRVR
jgi:Flp pilus assembly protein TadG